MLPMRLHNLNLLELVYCTLGTVVVVEVPTIEYRHINLQEGTGNDLN